MSRFFLFDLMSLTLTYKNQIMSSYCNFGIMDLQISMWQKSMEVVLQFQFKIVCYAELISNWPCLQLESFSACRDMRVI